MIRRPRLAGATAALLALAAVQVFSFVASYVSAIGVPSPGTPTGGVDFGIMLSLYAIVVVVASLPVPLVLRVLSTSAGDETGVKDRAGRDTLWNTEAGSTESAATGTESCVEGLHDRGDRETELRRMTSGGLSIGGALTIGSVFVGQGAFRGFAFLPWFALVLETCLILGYLVTAGLLFLEARQARVELLELAYPRDVEDRP